MTIRNTDFWQFINDYLPGYTSDPDVLWSDILTRYIDGEDVCAKDLLRIETEFQSMDEVAKELCRVDGELFADALKAYNEGKNEFYLIGNVEWKPVNYFGGKPLFLIRREKDDLLIICNQSDDNVIRLSENQIEGILILS